MTLNRTTGVISYIVPYAKERVTFRAGVTDGHGGSERADVDIEVISSGPVLITKLPSVLKGGAVVQIDLSSTGEGTPGFTYSLDRELPFIHTSQTFSTNGGFSVRPWNMDSGQYVLNISLGTTSTSLTLHRWSFTVVENASFIDPFIAVDSLGQNGGSLALRVTGSNGSLPLGGAMLTVRTDPGQQIITTIDLLGQLGSTIDIDVSGLNGSLMILVEMELRDTVDGNRTISSSITVELKDDDGNDRISGTIMVVLIVLILLFLLVILGVLLSVERTSYRLQSFFASGSSKNDEVILSLIQRRPGVRFRELQEGIAISRRELVSGLLSLTSSGHIRGVPDGTVLRFLPTVGSFVRGPLALDRSQGMLLDLLKGGAELTISELSSRSGLSVGSVNRELSLLALKDAVSTKGKGSDKRFYLDRKQKARLSSWARSGKQ